ncbi:MAG: DUF11 domain-containing protein [Acidobacteria bacterium]|nr:DUF11 domain-containing protein [Acidobacteriota bacterium]
MSLAVFLSVASIYADVSLTDKTKALRTIANGGAAKLSPAEKYAIAQKANLEKRDAKRKLKHPGNETNGAKLHAQANATGSAQLTDQSFMKYFIDTNITFSTSSSASGAMSEASYTQPVMASTSAGGVTSSTLNDAFDGYQTICVSQTGATGPCRTGDANYTIYNMNGPATVDTTVPATPACTGRQIAFNPKVIGPLTVSRKVFVPTNDSFARWINFFTNTSGAPVTFNMLTSNNLGSDSNTIIVSSSSGDAVATTADTWVSTFQNFSGNTSSDPREGHVLQGTGAATPLSIINFANGDDNPFWGYTITLAPGQTKAILNFVTLQPTKAAANSNAARIAGLPTTTTQCLSSAELGQVVNFATNADLSITKTASTPNPISGSNYSYTIQVNNAGPSQAQSVSVTDVLPAGVTYVSATGTGWTCNNAAGTVTCTMPTLAVGAAAPITLTVTPTGSGAIVNTATVTATNNDPNPANNSSTATVNALGAGSIPTLSTWVLGALAIGLGLIALKRLA